MPASRFLFVSSREGHDRIMVGRITPAEPARPYGSSPCHGPRRGSGAGVTASTVSELRKPRNPLPLFDFASTAAKAQVPHSCKLHGTVRRMPPVPRKPFRQSPLIRIANPDTDAIMALGARDSISSRAAAVMSLSCVE